MRREVRITYHQSPLLLGVCWNATDQKQELLPPGIQFHQGSYLLLVGEQKAQRQWTSNYYTLLLYSLGIYKIGRSCRNGELPGKSTVLVVTDPKVSPVTEVGTLIKKFKPVRNGWDISPVGLGPEKSDVCSGRFQCCFKILTAGRNRYQECQTNCKCL